MCCVLRGGGCDLLAFTFGRTLSKKEKRCRNATRSAALKFACAPACAGSTASLRGRKRRKKGPQQCPFLSRCHFPITSSTPKTFPTYRYFRALRASCGVGALCSSCILMPSSCPCPCPAATASQPATDQSKALP